MISLLVMLAKMLIAILPFLVLCYVNTKVNLPKTDRNKQYPMPVITLIYLVIVMFLLQWLNGWLLTLIWAIPKWIMGLGNAGWMPDLLGDGIYNLGKLIYKGLSFINLNYWIFFISNTVIIIVYLIVKKICKDIIDRKVKTDSQAHEMLSGKFYEFFPERNAWCLKDDFVQVRSMLKVFYYGAIILSCILMFVSFDFYYHKLIEAVFYPVFGIILVGELYFYLDGTTRTEYTRDILGEDEDAYRTVNYSLLRKFLRSVFGDKLLAENTSVVNTFNYTITTDEILRELETDDDAKVTTFAGYFDALHKTGFKIDHNYLNSSLELLKGKSILFNNPFYNDLIPYAFYPMNRMLLSHRKVLVVLGRHSIEDDITQWIEKGIQSVTNIPFMWNVGVLNSGAQDLDIGIITRSDVLDMELHNANAEFLRNVGYVVVIEPSKLISTAQIGLNLLVKQCRNKETEENIVYCLCDKNCDGLVDAMSHILMTSITEVSATHKHTGTSSYMCWAADEEYLHHKLVPNISRYLGVGTELSFAALKNQVAKTQWYGGDAFPVVDIRWIGKQYYYDLTKYAGLPANQEIMDEYFKTSSNFWSAEIAQNNYFTVEDEACNMFEILRDFSTRSTEQGFINVISSDYLLKDYMADNASLFEVDAKAIPYIVADYTRSNRNTILRVLLKLSTFGMSKAEIEKEFSLIGISVFDVVRQLWYEIYKCYANVSEIAQLPGDYKQAVAQVAKIPLVVNGKQFTMAVIRETERFSIRQAKLVWNYAIKDADFIEMCIADLKSAGYVAEDEKGEKYYLGSELSGQVYQKYLPGQFFTFGGKYYEMQYLTADGQVLVRRAADHINGRPEYRQIRQYIINGVMQSNRIGAYKNISGLKIVKEFADITVVTPGYYRMERYNDFSTAKKVYFEGEATGIPKRIYHNKEILRIELPDMAGKLSDKVRYTMALLFNEIFRTLFAENQAFICGVTDDTFITDESEEKPLTYELKADGCEIHPNSIYIIEDSQLDMGLTVAVERNLQRIFKIIHDYLDWHTEALEVSLNPPPEKENSIVFTDTPPEDTPPEETPSEDSPETPPENTTGETPEGEEAGESKKTKKKGVFKRIGAWFKKFFGKFKRKKKKKNEPQQIPEAGQQDPNVEIPAMADPSPGNPGVGVPAELLPPEEVNAEIVTEENSAAETPEESTVVVQQEEKDKTLAPVANEISAPKEKQKEKNGYSNERQPYHNRYYLLYGSHGERSYLDITSTLDYLTAMGMDKNPLKQARESRLVAELIEATFKPDRPDVRYCDFCGIEIFGVEYETLSDGRDRCLSCGRTAIKTGEEFRRIFEDVKRNMESFFGIKINAGIKVEMVNSRTLHKRLGKVFVPTPKSDGRILGIAISDKNGYTLMLENGSPRMASMLTIAHELTHIWQYENWKDKAICKKYGKKMRLEIYEGMAKWVEIQYAYLINEPALAKREEIITAYRKDEYGIGFLRYKANYPFSQGTVITKPTPFLNIEEPVADEFCGTFAVVVPTNGTNLVPGGDNGRNPATGSEDKLPEQPTRGPINRNPEQLIPYAFNLLNSQEKQVYETLLNAINNHIVTVENFPCQVNSTQIQKIVDYIQRDNPQLFWFQHGATYYYDTQTKIVNKVELKYCMTVEEARKRQAEIDAALNPFLLSISNSMSDYQLVLRVYENIINLVDYDTIGLEKQEKLPSTDEGPDDLRSIYGVFVNKKAVCAGYAKATQYLLNKYGIECLYVTSDTHAWNIVKIEGDYYHLDTTWGDGSDTKQEKSVTDAVNYDCFCITTQEVLRLKMHTPESVFPVPVCTATQCNYHRRHGLFMENFDYESTRAIVCDLIGNNNLNVTLKFATDKVYAEAKTALVDRSRFREIIQFSNLKSKIRVATGYTYCANDDRLTLNFYLKKI